ncbi:putative cytochrome P450 E-class, group I [Triangularia verruculosa]|uniref:Cytochrome P450 E-class, group I n=1 Tax=Triangularia verruculosa TaxID=2587418 RepID=A0AAN6XF33_9PEZI|nr:putative cytochrome P450 E-class, group I [Triangularia verruculosa]
MEFLKDLELSSTTICALVAASFAVWYTTTAFVSWYRLRNLPGPPTAKFSYFWQFQTIVTGRVGDRYLNLRDYGPLVVTAPGTVVTDDPDVLRKISGARSSYGRSLWYAGAKFTHDTDSMGTQVDTVAHDTLKAKTAGPYAGRETEGGLEKAVDAQLIRLIDLIRRKYLSRNGELRPVDFSLVSRYFTLDVISGLIFGKPWGHLDEGADVLDWCSSMDTLLPLMTMGFELPALRSILIPKYGLLRWFGPRATDKSGLGVVIKHVNELICQRFENQEKHAKDMMSGFIRNGMTRTECEGETILAILAGTDTTASTIRSSLLYLMLSPHAYARFKKEIKEAVEQRKVSSPITNEESLTLPYTQAVMWEAFRIGSALTFGHYKVVPRGGDTIHGLYLPEGTNIGHNTIALTHKKAIFGEDADVFRPERFLECNAQQKAEMIRALDIVFGGGRWTCAGKNVAILELNKVMFELMRHFDFQVVNVHTPVKERAYVGKLHDDMFVRISEADWDIV